MVKQTRHIFDLSDIKAVRLQCGHCRKEAVQPLKATEVGKECPFCGQDWEVSAPQGARGDNWLMIRCMRQLLKEDSPLMTARFEIDGESDGQSVPH